MKKTKVPYRKQIFVCCHEKADGSGCKSRGGEELRMKLKENLNKQPEMIGKVRVNKCGCMDFCNNGIAVQIQPEDKLFLDVSIDDADKIWEEFCAN